MHATKKQLSNFDLAQFTGDLERFQNSLNQQVIYTPGVKYLAEHGQAYWLIDAIASWFETINMLDATVQDSRLQDLQFWELRVAKDKTAQLLMRADSGVEPAIVQEIEYTDFPLNHVRIWAGWDGTYWTLYLPSEH